MAPIVLWHLLYQFLRSANQYGTLRADMRYPAKALRSYREKKRLSQEEVAERLKVSRRLVGMWMTGKRIMKAEWAIEIEKQFGINRVLHRPDLFRRRVAT